MGGYDRQILNEASALLQRKYIETVFYQQLFDTFDNRMSIKVNSFLRELALNSWVLLKRPLCMLMEGNKEVEEQLLVEIL